MPTQPTYLNFKNTNLQVEQTQACPVLNTANGQLQLLAWVEEQLAESENITNGDYWGMVEDLALDCNAYDESLGAGQGTIELVFYPVAFHGQEAVTNTQTIVARMTIKLEDMPLIHSFKPNTLVDVTERGLATNGLYEKSNITKVFLVRKTRPNYNVGIYRVYDGVQVDESGNFFEANGCLVDYSEMILPNPMAVTYKTLDAFLAKDLLAREQWSNHPNQKSAIDYIRGLVSQHGAKVIATLPPEKNSKPKTEQVGQLELA